MRVRELICKTYPHYKSGLDMERVNMQNINISSYEDEGRSRRINIKYIMEVEVRKLI
jgi:hypothetical protein